jgi:hypothetical protein
MSEMIQDYEASQEMVKKTTSANSLIMKVSALSYSKWPVQYLSGIFIVAKLLTR